MKDNNVKAKYKKAKIVRRYKFLVPVNTELVCACPGSSYEQIQKVEEGITKYIKPSNPFKAKCNNDQIMEAHGQKNVDLGAYECMSDIDMDIRDIKDPREEWMCPEPYAWQGIGFDVKLEGTVQRYNLLEICYDKIKKHTIYVEHEWINGASSGLPPSFTWRGEKNGEYDQDWHKGHLAPAGDFNIYELKKFTYFYANAAPQYKTLNSGKWSHQVEINVRKEFSEATIFTGTSYFKFKTGAKKTRNKLTVRKMAKSNLATTDVIEGKPDVFWKIAIGEDKEQKAKVKGYLYSNKIDFYLDRLHRIWRKSKKSVSKGYRLEGRDVKLIADLLKIADGNNNYSRHVDHPSQRIWKYIESVLND
ncbi:uncharacterized protein LOC135942882 [Cloeon dipterum]|uniref:uncharacterized protein LOC135942882 n=1 Tax=Cloeon dipterum TaxID=197152 RepID=UPI00321FDB8C